MDGLLVGAVEAGVVVFRMLDDLLKKATRPNKLRMRNRKIKRN